MKILAIEASGLTAGCAVAEDEKLIGEYNLQYQKTHSQTLVPMLEELKRALELDLTTIDAIAITKGPGSFTGLRIGAATAKGIALALDKPILPVSTLDSLAFNAYGTQKLVCPIMDARRQQVYTGIYRENGWPECLRQPCAVSIDELLEDLNEWGEAVLFVGDGVPVYREQIVQKAAVPVSFAPAHLLTQRAGTTAVLASLLFEKEKEGCLISADDFRPEYLRKSHAERQKDEAMASGHMDSLAAGRLLRDLGRK